MNQLNKISLLLLITTIFIAGFFAIKDPTLYLDETVHHQVINSFCHLDFTIHPNLTNIPAYHAILGGICYIGSYITPINSIYAVRVASLLLSLLSLYFLYLIAQKLKHQTPILTSLQLLLLPLAFPFFFFVYTDIPSITPIALALLLTLNQKYAWAGLLITLSIAFRQNNFIWLGWLVIFILFQKWPSKYNFKSLINYLFESFKKVWMFALGTVAFAAFIKLNGGISLAKAEEWAHPSFSLHFGNVYLMLILFTIIFLPLVIANLSNINRLYQHKKLLIFFSLTFFFIAYTFLFQFGNTHPYNQHTFGLHNRILVLITQSFTYRLLALIPIFLALLTIFSTKFRQPIYYSMYPFALLFVLPSWLIEPRYYIIPFYFYLLFKKASANTTNISLVIWELLLSTSLLYGTLNKLFLL